MDLLALAKNIADRVEAQSARAEVPVAVSVIDVHGNIILKHRISGAPTFSIELSERKAYTSALVGLRTADLFPLVQPGRELFPLMGLSGGRFCSMGGGAPLTSEGHRVAGVGVSGGTVDQDVASLNRRSERPDAEAAAPSCRSLMLPITPVTPLFAGHRRIWRCLALHEMGPARRGWKFATPDRSGACGSWLSAPVRFARRARGLPRPCV
jgi:uncharacterized protein GlcG (DUF336 family)